ncbi:MAG: ABC transporter ATP-binding protein, partial [Opitutales bacterium]
MPNPKPNSYASLFRYMGKHRKRFIWINLLHLLNASLNLVPAATVGLFIDVVLTQEPTSVFGLSIEPEWFHARFTQAQMIAAYGIGMLALIVFANLVGVVMWRKMIESVQSILLDLKMDIRAHLNRLSLTYYQREQTGAIMEKSLGDVQRLEMFFRVFFHLSYSSLHLIIAPVLMLGQSWMLFFAVLIPTPLIAYSVWLIQHKLKPMYRQLREKESSAASLIQETVSGIREIKAYTMEDRSNAKYRDVSKSVYDQNIDIVRIFSISHQTQYSTHDIAIVLIAVIGGTLIVGGTGSVTPGIMTSFIALTGHFFNPIRSFVGFFETIQRGIVSWDRIREFLDEEALESDASEGVMLERSNVRGEVRFEHVGFSYHADQPILRDIDFTLPAGKNLGIVGTTGRGKTTRMSLLLRFFEP